MYLEEIRAQAELLTNSVVISPGDVPAEQSVQHGAVQTVPRNLKFRFELPGEKAGVRTEYLIHGLMPKAGLMAIYGAAGAGKSFAALDAVAHIAAGKPYFGRDVLGGAAVYVAAEGGIGMHKRLDAWRIFHGVAQLPIALVTRAPNLGSTSGKPGSDVTALINDITAQLPLLNAPLRLIVFDTLARCMPGADENSAQAMGSVISNAAEISAVFNDILVILVHHVGKNEALGMRGHSSLHGACDAEWQVAANSDGEKTILLKKLKEGADRLSWAFNLEPVVVNGAKSDKTQDVDCNGSDEQVVSSCVVNPICTPDRTNGDSVFGGIKGNDAMVLAALKETTETSGEVMPEQEGIPFDTVGVRRNALKQAAKDKGIGDPDNAKSQATMINRSIVSLVNKGYVGANDEWVWLSQ